MELSNPTFTFFLIINKEITSNTVQDNAHLIDNPLVSCRSCNYLQVTSSHPQRLGAAPTFDGRFCDWWRNSFPRFRWVSTNHPAHSPAVMRDEGQTAGGAGVTGAQWASIYGASCRSFSCSSVVRLSFLFLSSSIYPSVPSGSPSARLVFAHTFARKYTPRFLH